jgi:hypothetical protein
VSVTIPLFAVFGGVLVIVTLIMLYFYLPAAAKLKVLRIQSAGELHLIMAVGWSCHRACICTLT